MAGDLSVLPDLAKATQRILPNVARLVRGARSAGARVIHCVAEQRPDRFGANRNARIFQAVAKAGGALQAGSPSAEIVPEVPVAEGDVVLSRIHGLSPFQGTELDFLLRNEGVTTLVATGVSVNVAIQNLAFDAVNASYQVVVPRDAVAGFPDEYVEAVFRNTLGAVATLVATDDVLAAWGVGSAGSAEGGAR